MKALIFDFDGLVLDTEVPEYETWKWIYEEYGATLPMEKWIESIGATNVFDPYKELADQIGHPLDKAEIRAKWKPFFAQLMAKETLLPGVKDYLIQGKALGLKLAIASSSHYDWVSGHLKRFQLESYFDSIKCADDVEKTKPDPALYLLTLQALNIEAHEAIVFEDSLNGILAAKRAGLYCVAVPNALTKGLSLNLADLQLSSLAEIALPDLLTDIRRKSRL